MDVYLFKLFISSPFKMFEVAHNLKIKGKAMLKNNNKQQIRNGIQSNLTTAVNTMTAIANRRVMETTKKQRCRFIKTQTLTKYLTKHVCHLKLNTAGTKQTVVGRAFH